MSASAPLRVTGVSAPPQPVVPMESAIDHGVAPIDPRRDSLDRWSAALACGDVAEVDRLVRQSRIDRTMFASSGRLAATHQIG